MCTRDSIVSEATHECERFFKKISAVARTSKMSGHLCSKTVRIGIMRYTAEIHPYLSLVVCSFGIVSSVLCIIVLSQRRIWTPINTFLIALAVADMTVMAAYVPFADCEIADDKFIYGVFGTSTSYFCSAYFNYNRFIYQVFHSAAIWVTVTLAVWRYLTVCWHPRSKGWCTQRRAIAAVLSVFLCVAIVHMPMYIGNEVRTLDKNYYLVRPIIFKTWILGVLVKLVPYIALTILNLMLVWSLVQAKKRRRQMEEMTWSLDFNGLSTGDGRPHSSEGNHRVDHTTRMVMVIITLFLFTEFPQVVMVLLVADGRVDFFRDCTYYLDRPMEVPVLLNSAIKFAMYCVMSHEFRQTFKDVFSPSRGVCFRQCRREESSSEGNKDEGDSGGAVNTAPDSLTIASNMSDAYCERLL